MFKDLVGSQEKKHLARLKNDSAYATAYRNTPVSIYAELTKKQLTGLCSGDITMQLPHGSFMKRKNSSRGIFIMCADRDIASMVESGLDISGVSWQEM